MPRKKQERNIHAEYREKLDRRAVRRARDRAKGKKPRIYAEKMKPLTLPAATTVVEAQSLALARNINPPDFSAWCGHSGGHLDHPTPYIRKFPLAQTLGIKRKVEVSVTKYWGIGQHYYVTMKEEDNPVWSIDPEPTFRRDNGHWIRLWEDPDVNGITISERCMNPIDVNTFVQQAFAQEFSPETHELENREGQRQWFYRDGD